MKISVCIATYNGEKYIRQQISSILNQITDNDEVIISDDNSNDETLDIIESFRDDRIKIFSNKIVKTNILSLISNFENALLRSSGNVIFLADQDDIWLDGKIQKMLRMLENYDLVVSNAKVVDENLNVIHDSFFGLRNSGQGLIKNLYKNTYVGCCMAFNRKIYDFAIPFPPKVPMHDWWIGCVAEIYGKVYFADERLLLYRRHGNNASASSEVSSKHLTEQLISRVQIIYYLIDLQLRTRKSLKSLVVHFRTGQRK